MHMLPQPLFQHFGHRHTVCRVRAEDLGSRA